MKKIINNPENFISEMLDGLYAAHADCIQPVDGNYNCLISKQGIDGKVGLVTGGGSGHLPLFLGYVGEGMLDGCAVGGVFQAPSADDVVTVTRAVDSGNGVLFIIGNYNGDRFNFRIAGKTVDMEDGIKTATVIGADDVASGPLPTPGKIGIRRGVAGIFFIFKCAGAAANLMLPLEQVRSIAQRVSDNVRTIGVALSPCTVPRVGKSSFTIAEDEMEIGMGIHGEPGIHRFKIRSAREIVAEMMDKLLPDGQFFSGDEVAVLINGLGATPLEEQYLVFGEVKIHLDTAGISVYRTYVGEFATSLEMAGLSISLLKLDNECKTLLDMQANTPFFKQFGKE